MRIGIVSDTHDRSETVSEALRLLAEQRVELILHCGDIESPQTVSLFKDIPTHFVFGNWDRDRARLTAAIKAIKGTSYESFGAMELAGKRIAWLHSHERNKLRDLEYSNYFDFIFYGHTHMREQHRTGKTLVANPGALFRANPKTCVVLDVISGELKPIIVPVAMKGHPAPSALVEVSSEGSVILESPAVTSESSPPPPHS